MQNIAIKQLSLLNFKNYDSIDLSFDTDLVCFAGNNGKGKTNLLDAIYYMCFCKSFINNSDALNIKDNQSFFAINANVELDENVQHLYCAFKKEGGKIFKKNKKEYERLAQHIGLIPLVLMSPADVFLLHDGSEVRRKFLDGIISQYNKNYLHQLLQYNKALVQRNALLKNFADNSVFSSDLLEIWDMQLTEYGTEVYKARSKFISDFIGTFQHFYHLLSPDKEDVKLEFQSQLQQAELSILLKQSLSKDCAVTYTTQGPHKDELVFLLNGKPLKKIASQGQQKTYLTALKLAQYQYLAKLKNVKPILLIDDIYDKLDPSRVLHLLELVTSESFGQVFITDTNPERITKIFNDIRAKFQLFLVGDGTVKQIS